jgi:hypothetical protein
MKCEYCVKPGIILMIIEEYEPGFLRWYSDWLRAGRPRDQMMVEVRFLAIVMPNFGRNRP